MLALLRAAPGPLAVRAEHVEVELLRLVVLVQVLDVGSVENQDGRRLRHGELLFLAAGDDAAGGAALGACIRLGDERNADGLAALAGHLLGGQPRGGAFGDLQGPLVVAGEDQVAGGAFVGAQRHGRFHEGDRGFVIVHFRLRFRLGFRIGFLAGKQERKQGHDRPQEIFLHYSVMVMLNCKVAV